MSYISALVKSILVATLAAQYKRQVISTTLSPAPAGPYSQGIKVGPTLYVTGTIGTHPSTGLMVSTATTAQARRALKNSRAVVRAAGMTFRDVAMVTIFITNIRDLPAVNKVYQKFFKKPYPARSSVEVRKLPYNAKIMIKMVAVKA